MSTRRNIPQRKQTVRPNQGTENLSDEIVNIVEVKEHAQDFLCKTPKINPECHDRPGIVGWWLFGI
ncbi:MAG: hypothetical protein IPO65_19645 [Saprospiraceae bacterium]|nr:hypothetical protein [Saprospiraceae bacterium]